MEVIKAFGVRRVSCHAACATNIRVLVLILMQWLDSGLDLLCMLACNLRPSAMDTWTNVVRFGNNCCAKSTRLFFKNTQGVLEGGSIL